MMIDRPEPLNHVFVDGENIGKLDLNVLNGKRVVLHLLIGPKQTKLDTDVVERILDGSDAVRLIRLKKSGKNALDFALAYYLGQTAVTDPLAYYHIVSKDTGYDPLIEHLKSRHLRLHRHADFSTLTFGNPPTAAAPKVPATRPSVAEPGADLQKVRDHFKKLENQRPKQKKSLISYLQAYLSKLPADVIQNLVERLESEGHISINEKGGVTYNV